MQTITTSMRLRSRVSDAAVRDRLGGKILGEADYDVLLTGPARITKPDGRPLCVYLPGVMTKHSQDDEVYEILHSLRGIITKNRGAASGTKRLDPSARGRSYAKEIPSMIAGAIDPAGQKRYCRLTAWTGENLPSWQRLQPMLLDVAAHLAEQVPDRFAAQAEQAQASDPAWIVPGTPFSTITVNNTYPTGVHTDKGDLDAGFSTITSFRRGSYTGGRLVFPAYRVAVDMADGDLILMDAHEWHGNTAIVCTCGKRLTGPCDDCGAERISIVSYFRTKVAQCGTPEAEYDRATAWRERNLVDQTGGALVQAGEPETGESDPIEVPTATGAATIPASNPAKSVS